MPSHLHTHTHTKSQRGRCRRSNFITKAFIKRTQTHLVLNACTYEHISANACTKRKWFTFVVTYLHTDIDTHAHTHTQTHTNRLGYEQSLFLFSDSSHMPGYPGLTSLETNHMWSVCVCVFDCVWACHFLPLVPSPSPPVSSLRYHVNKARFSPSKGSARQLPAGGDRAERQRRKIEKEISVESCAEEQNEGGLNDFWVKAGRLEEREKRYSKK